MLETAWKNIFVLEFLLFNNNEKVDLKKYTNVALYSLLSNSYLKNKPKIETRKGLISYYKTCGITFF
jgi:hypothetical protein